MVNKQSTFATVVILLFVLLTAPAQAQDPPPATCAECVYATPAVWTPITDDLPTDALNTRLISITAIITTNNLSATNWINNYITLTAPAMDDAGWYNQPVRYVRILYYFKWFRRAIPFLLAVLLFRIFIMFAVFVVDNIDFIMVMVMRVLEVIRWIIDFILQLIEALTPVILAVMLTALLTAPAQAQDPTPTAPDPSYSPLLPTPFAAPSATQKLDEWWCFNCADVGEEGKYWFIQLNAWHLVDAILMFGIAAGVYTYVEQRALPWVRQGQSDIESTW